MFVPQEFKWEGWWILVGVGIILIIAGVLVAVSLPIFLGVSV